MRALVGGCRLPGRALPLTSAAALFASPRSFHAAIGAILEGRGGAIFDARGRSDQGVLCEIDSQRMLIECANEHALLIVNR